MERRETRCTSVSSPQAPGTPVTLTAADGTVTVGITDHAQDQLGDVVFVENPPVGSPLTKGKEAAVVESVKAAADI